MYAIPAIPTTYNERRYRSRLEAKWAAFFDAVGWKHEYEPFDLGEWSPDFLLKGHIDVLVEIKPITEIDTAVTDRMARAARATNWRGDLLLLGVAPCVETSVLPWDGPALGWLGEGAYHGQNITEVAFDFAHAGLGQDQGRVDFSHEFNSYTGRMFGFSYKQADSVSLQAIERIWSKAVNQVQWRPR